MLALVARFSLHLLLPDLCLVLLTLRHLEEGVDEAKGEYDEDHEEPHDLKGKVPLLFEVIPLIDDVQSSFVQSCSGQRCRLARLLFGDCWLVFGFHVDGELVEVDVFLFSVSLGAILHSPGLNCVTRLLVDLVFEEWTALGVDFIAHQMDDLVFCVEIDGEVLGDGLEIIGDVAPNFLQCILYHEFLGHMYQFILERIRLSDNFTSCILNFLKACLFLFDVF